VDSGNDACVAMAEYVAGSEDAFANLMNQTAQILGMKNTFYVDSTGLPDPRHYSSPHDLALLGRALIYSFPEDYQWYSQKWFTYHGIRQPNRNRLLWRDPSFDGIKTGHTCDRIFCLVSSAKRNGTRLIAVVMGAPSDAARADDSQKLLDYGFRFFETHLVYPANTKLTQARVWHGADKNVDVGVIEPFIISVIPGQFPQIQYQLNLTKELTAPVTKGAVVGNIEATLNGKVIDQAPVVTMQDDPVGNFLRRLWDKIDHWWHKKN
jgi:D-alanyl-D-alanine carboxypeptidase (penicillin-binding protein 5/6)